MLAWQERHPQIGDVRGLGAMLAMEYVRDPATKEPAPELASRVAEEAAQRGLLLLKAGTYSNCNRVLCPLVITDAELDEALGAWEDALDAVLRVTVRGGPALVLHVARTSPTTPAARGNKKMIGDVIADRYEVLEVVGAGGMSSVYKAHDQLLERNVALKVLHARFGDDAEYVERFRREARAVAQLSHPNIVTVIDRGEADGHQFIVFEFIDGENLKELVERTGPLPVRRAVELALAIAEGLCFAHEHGIVHRDVKPQNVLLNGDGEAKVTDFGIARSLDVEHGVTQTGTVLGTSNYLSPEQATGQPVTPATDIYSLGVVLYELLTGDVPFSGRELRRRGDQAPRRSRAGHHGAPPGRPAAARGGDGVRAREGSGAALPDDARLRHRAARLHGAARPHRHRGHHDRPRGTGSCARPPHARAPLRGRRTELADACCSLS